MRLGKEPLVTIYCSRSILALNWHYQGRRVKSEAGCLG